MPQPDSRKQFDPARASAKINKIASKIFKLALWIPKDIEERIAELTIEEETNFRSLTDSFEKVCKLLNARALN